MATPENSTSQNHLQGVGTTGTPLPAPARSQKDGGIGNSTVGTFSVCNPLISLPQILMIKEIGQVWVGPNAQGLLIRSSPERRVPEPYGLFQGGVIMDVVTPEQV
jgi:hypothetical protein